MSKFDVQLLNTKECLWIEVNGLICCKMVRFIYDYNKVMVHIISTLKKIFYKIIYGSKLSTGKHTTWRRNFLIMIANEGKANRGAFNNDCTSGQSVYRNR